MANTVDKVLVLAEAEEGYLEKSAAAYRQNPQILYEKTKGAGYDNYTKYGKEMHDIYPQVMDFPAAWCDAYVDYLFYRAYGTATAKSLLGGGFDDYTVASAKMYQKHGALDKTPSVGAQVFFTRDGQVSGCYHTGLVTAFDGTIITTSEGNTSAGSGVIPNGGGVCRKRYTYSYYKDRLLFGHPAYDTPGSPNKVSPDTAPKTSVSSIPKYVAEVTASLLNVRTWAGTGYPNIKSWPQLSKGNYVDVCDTITAADGSLWCYVRIAGQYYGFVSADWLRRVNG